MRDSQKSFSPTTLWAERGAVDLAERHSHWRERDWRMIRRIALWSVVAMAAAGATVLSVQTETGAQRLAALLNPPAPAPNAEARGAGTPSAPASMLEASAAEAIRAEVQELSRRLGRLADDTARLSARLEVVERSLDPPGSVPNSPAAEASPGRPDNTADGFAEAPQHAMVAGVGFGIDLGPAGSLEELRERWAVVRAQHGGLLEDLWPVAAIERVRPAHASGMRLIVGPLSNLYAAARLCAVINRTGRMCRPTRLEGERMALR